ncbi:MAG TPA: hypothetical protein VJN95_09755 [Gemmatimonadales bacterium]|nr:hypothetical protein [Gemmatimonadales bacterium]
MLRLRLPSGEEVVFRTSEEFALAVRQGSVDDSATILHVRSGQWLPVTSHPIYRSASNSHEPPVAPLEDELRPVAPTALLAPTPHYAEPRRQTPRGAEGLGRPADARSDGLVVVLAALLVAGLVLLALKRPFEQRPSDDPTPTLSWTGLGHPGSLAVKHGSEEQRMVAQLIESLQGMGTVRALLPDGVDAPELIDQAAVRIRSSLDTIADYRRRAAQLDRQYADTAGRVGQNEGLATVPVVDAQDSLYSLGLALAQLLITERGHLHAGGESVVFDRPAPAGEYERLRLALAGEATVIKRSPRTARLVEPFPPLPSGSRAP